MDKNQNSTKDMTEAPLGVTFMTQCAVAGGATEWQGIDAPTLSVNDVAKILRVSTRNIWRLVAKCELSQPTRIGKLCRWFIADVRDYIEKLKSKRAQKKN